jgi:phage baseplate assembly protein W
MNGDKTFLGTGWGFPPSFDPSTRRAVLASHEEDVAQSLWILLSTTPGERTLQPTFGCGVKKLVFEPITESTLTEMRDLIRRAVLFFEPRVTLESVEFDLDRMMDGELGVRLVYRIRSTNSRANLVYPLYLFEGRQPAAFAPGG